MDKIHMIKIGRNGKKEEKMPFGYEGKENRKLGMTSRGLTRDGQPWYPVMGEFHFSRFRDLFWKDEIYKMKAGGIQILATYVFWIHHEEKRGEWDFTGSRDLRKFLKTVEECGVPVLLRIGPWSHGECRNGGFPDWLLGEEGIQVRTDQELYLSYVKIFFDKLYEQAKGLLWKQGGPVIGIQIENEYGHCGGLTGEAGIKHMCRIKKLAKEAGFDVPYYTATGWGGGIVPEGETIPVLGGYCDAPWEQHIHEMPANANYVFSNNRDDGNIGSDLQREREQNFTYDVERYPFFTAELGGGMQPTGHRRPIANKKDIAAMTLCKLGSGANLLGYYMYHGGTNPKGRYSTLQESKETGYLNDLPALSYDFQAPIGEFGRLQESFYHLRPWHLFLAEFGGRMVKTETIFPEWNSEEPDDLEHLRVAVRNDFESGSGFLFINAYQRHRKMQEHPDTEIGIEMNGKKIIFPSFSVRNGSYGCYPYHLEWGKVQIESTNAQLLCTLGDKLVFYADGSAQYKMQGSTEDIITITQSQAEHAWKIGELLYIADGCICEGENGYELLTYGNTGKLLCLPSGQETTYECSERNAEVSVLDTVREDGYTEYRLVFSYADGDWPENYWLRIDFDGDRAECLIGKELEADWFYTGKTWYIGLRYFDWPKEAVIRIYDVKEEVYVEKICEENCRIHRMDIQTEYRIGLGEL